MMTSQPEGREETREQKEKRKREHIPRPDRADKTKHQQNRCSFFFVQNIGNPCGMGLDDLIF